MGENVNVIRDISDKTAHKLDSVSNNVDKLSGDTLFIKEMASETVPLLATILRMVAEIQRPVEKVFEVAVQSRPFLKSVSESFEIVWRLWGMLSSLLHSYFHVFQNIPYGPHVAVLLLICMFGVWLFRCHTSLKFFSVVVLCTIERFPLDDFERASMLSLWRHVSVFY